MTSSGLPNYASHLDNGRMISAPTHIVGGCRGAYYAPARYGTVSKNTGPPPKTRTGDLDNGPVKTGAYGRADDYFPFAPLHTTFPPTSLLVTGLLRRLEFDSNRGML